VLEHVQQETSFVLEGHRYRDDRGRDFFVFTAGNGSVWSAAAVNSEGTFGDFLVRAADSRVDCVQQLESALGT
jgi:hypothetical protein